MALRGGILLAALAVASLLVVLNWGGESSNTLRAGGPPPTPTVTPTPDPAFNAAAEVISDSADLIEGPLSRGVLGDYLLANSEIQVVIQAPQRNLLNVGQFGGQIIDADLVRQGADPERDNFEEWAFGINLENTAHYDTVQIVNDGSNGQPAVIRASGVDDLLDFINPSSQVADFGFPFPAEFDDADLPVEISTDYILAPNKNYVEVNTTVTNLDSVETVETFFTEFIGASGEVEQFLAGYGFGEPMVTTACDLCNYVAWSGQGAADGVSYGYIQDVPDTTVFTTSGVTIPALGISAALALVGGEPPNQIIDPLDDVSVTRYFAVGDGSVGAIVDIRNEILGLTTGTLSGTVISAGQPVEGADVAVLGAVLDGPGTTKNVVSHYRTDANGEYSGTLPPGAYTVHAHADGHLAATPNPASVTVLASSTTDQGFTIPEAGRVQVTVEDENNNDIAGKVSIIGFDPYVDPENTQTVLGVVNNRTALFGEVSKDRMPFGLTQVRFVDQTGDSGEFYLEPGDYRVVVSHGTEYSVYGEDITVTSGNLSTVNAQIARVIDTTGFVSGEFHIHQLASPDSATTNEDRVISLLAEGVDFVAPSDHEHRTDLTPTISDLGVGSLLSTAGNAETTTADYGHFNAWPMTFDLTKPNKGAIDWAGAAPLGQDFPSYGNYTLSPGEIFAALQADPGEDAVQINHADSFFGPGGLSIDTAYIPPQDFADNADKRLDPAITNLFDDGFTSMEVWQGTDRNDIARTTDRRMGDWFNMINQGIVRTGTAVSDTHKLIANQSGFPRTMMPSSTDDAGALGPIAESLASNINDGKGTGTNGPYVVVSGNATSTGESAGLGLADSTLLSTTNGSATIDVDIQSPTWAEFDRVEYYINNVPFPNDFDNNPTTPPYWNTAPDVVQTAGVDFTINTVDDFPLIPGGSHLEASTSVALSGLTEDTWVVVLVRGSDGVSSPIFPVVPNDLQQSGNTTLADLTDGNVGELGVPALAFTNPLFIDVNNNNVYDTHPVDNDRDGCTNDEELQPASSASDGGGRSPSSIWDVYDTDTENLAAAGTHLEGAVFVGDITKVVLRFGKTGSPAIDPLSNASGTGYHTRYDRGGPIMGQNAWNLRPPNGSITIADIVNVVGQFGHNCL
ncbi:MAG: flexitail domain-containing putative surface protein [Dehalococcoidia bacterium]